MALARLRGLDLASGCHLEPLLAARLGLHLGHFRLLFRSVERATRHATLAGRAQTGAPYTPRPAVSQGGSLISQARYLPTTFMNVSGTSWIVYPPGLVVMAQTTMAPPAIRVIAATRGACPSDSAATMDGIDRTIRTSPSINARSGSIEPSKPITAINLLQLIPDQSNKSNFPDRGRRAGCWWFPAR